MSLNARLTISELARLGGVHVETVRYYQRRGLLAVPRRKPGSIRRYGDADVRRLRFIRSLRGLGFTLQEASMLLDERRREDARELVARKRTQMRIRREGLDRILDVLDTAHGELERPDGKSVEDVLGVPLPVDLDLDFDAGDDRGESSEGGEDADDDAREPTG